MMRVLGHPAGPCRPPLGPCPEGLEAEAKRIYAALHATGLFTPPRFMQNPKEGKIQWQKGRWNWYAQGAYMGLVAEGGPTATITYTGWGLKDSGSGWEAAPKRVTGPYAKFRGLPITTQVRRGT